MERVVNAVKVFTARDTTPGLIALCSNHVVVVVAPSIRLAQASRCVVTSRLVTLLHRQELFPVGDFAAVRAATAS